MIFLFLIIFSLESQAQSTLYSDKGGNGNDNLWTHFYNNPSENLISCAVLHDYYNAELICTNLRTIIDYGAAVDFNTNTSYFTSPAHIKYVNQCCTNYDQPRHH